VNHLMIDLETLGTRFDAPIISLGAVFFEPSTGELGGKFYGGVDIADACKYGKPSGGTIRWWLEQGDAARAAIVKSRHELPFVLGRFRDFCAKCDRKFLKVWGNGATFDISILDYAFPRVLNEASPWDFWNVRDCRTIRELAGDRITVGKAPGTEHHALDDAMHQARWTSDAWRVLRGMPVATPPTPDSELI
jgi:hypothetical protein